MSENTLQPTEYTSCYPLEDEFEDLLEDEFEDPLANEFEDIGNSLQRACMDGQVERLKSIIATSKYDLKNPPPQLQSYIDLAVSIACVFHHHDTIKECIKCLILSSQGLRLAKYHAKNDQATLAILATVMSVADSDSD